MVQDPWVLLSCSPAEGSTSLNLSNPANGSRSDPSPET